MKSLPNLTPLAGTPGSPQLITANTQQDKKVRTNANGKYNKTMTTDIAEHRDNDEDFCLGKRNRWKKQKNKERLTQFVTSSFLSDIVWWALIEFGVLDTCTSKYTNNLKLHSGWSLRVNELFYAFDPSSSPHKQNLTIWKQHHWFFFTGNNHFIHLWTTTFGQYI